MESNFTNIYQAIHEISGIYLTEDKQYLVESRLGDLLKKYDCPDFNEMARKLRQKTNKEMIDEVIEEISTHETLFFRDKYLFEALEHQIIREWMERTSDSFRDLTIWSAGCSTGQEAYSIAMIIHNKFPELKHRTSIIGTDIAKKSLAKAQAALFSDFEIERGLPGDYRERYFNRVENKLQLSDEIRGMVKFFQHNLLEDAVPGPVRSFDIIFFRNVAIYFHDEHRRKIYRAVKDVLNPNGVLVLGASESPLSYIDNCIVREYKMAHYYEFSENVTLF